MQQMRAAGAPLIALAVVLAAALVAAALLAPRPWAVRAGAPGDAYVFSNSFPPERGDRPLRWTRAETGLQLHGAYAGPGALTLRLYREPTVPANIWPLALRAGPEVLAGFEAAPGWRRYTLALPPGAATQALSLSGPTFVPGNGDARELGVALSDLELRPLSGAAPVGYALGRAAWLGGALGLLAAAAWLLDRWSLGAARRSWRILALVGGLGVALVAWAWLGPASLAWALPTSWVPLALGAALVAALLVADPRPLLRRGRSSGRPPPAHWAVIGLLVVAHFALLAPLPALWRQVAALLILVAPGALAAMALLGDEADWPERLFLGLAGGLGVAALLVLALHALPGGVPAWALLVAADGLSAAGLWALWRRPLAAPGPTLRLHRWLILPLLLGACLRLCGLGTAQFQGDEAYAMLLARGVLHGQDEILLVHMKGPLEALLPAGPLVLTGTISETAARLPFALAGLALVAGAWSLAGRLIGGRLGDLAGFVAALGVACDGLLLAFGRIVQYQTMVLLMAAAALWLCWRFTEGASARRTLPAAALCAAVAVLAHYDGIYVAPALAWLVLIGGLRRGWDARAWAAGLGAPVAIGLALTLSFYLPFALHEHFAQTLSHLETRSGQGESAIFYNNLPGYAALLSVYATRYAGAFVGLALLGTLAALLAGALRPRPLGLALALLLAVGGPLALLAPGPLRLGPDASLAALFVVPPLLALALAARLPVGLRALLLWFAGAFCAHAFLLADPRTHFYTAHLAGWLIAGWGLARLWELASPARAALRGAVAATGVATLGLSLAYSGMVFLRPWPEYERAYPATLLPLFTPPSGLTLPDDGLFAFPARDGWKVVAALFADGTLRGVMDTNQERFTPGWYLRGQFVCQRDPDYFLTANGVAPLYIPPGYSHFGTVEVDGVQSLEIYSRAPVAGPPQRFDAATYAARYDATPVPDFPLRRLLSGVVPQVARPTPWSAGFALRGFDLDRRALGPGERAFLTLYWRAELAQPDTLAPTVLLQDAAGRTVRELPSTCGGVPSEDWHTTYRNDTPFALDAAGLPAGDYTLRVGVRELGTNAWLPLAGGGELLTLATVRVVQ